VSEYAAEKGSHTDAEDQIDWCVSKAYCHCTWQVKKCHRMITHCLPVIVVSHIVWCVATYSLSLWVIFLWTSDGKKIVIMLYLLYSVRCPVS